nr:IS66 family insertion sequence hypothetical protein [Rhizobium sp. Q54]
MITPVEGGRRWSREQRGGLVLRALTRESEEAPAAGIHLSQLFRWRQELCQTERGREMGRGVIRLKL